MALTTQTASDIRDRVVSEFNPKQDNLRVSEEAAILLDKSVVARPLMVPEVASIHVKRPEFYYRWVNRLSQGGRVYMERKALGFVNATSDDVDVLVGDVTSSDTEIRCGDVILMRMPYQRWAEHVKSNMKQSIGLQRRFKNEEPPSETAAAAPNRVRTYAPPNPDAIVDAQTKDAAAKARKIVADIRAEISGEKE